MVSSKATARRRRTKMKPKPLSNYRVKITEARKAFVIPSASSDSGDLAVAIALIAVLLLALIPIVTYANSSNLLPLARGNQDYQSALTAAESGVSDYLNQLNQNSSTPPLNPALTGWVQVPGSTNEYFHYSTTYSSSGKAIVLTSTGVTIHGAQTKTRTIQETISPNTFANFELYYNSMAMLPSLANAISGNPQYYVLNNVPAPSWAPPGTMYTNGNYYLHQANSFKNTLETGATIAGTCASGYIDSNSGSCGTPSSNPVVESSPVIMPSSFGSTSLPPSPTNLIGQAYTNGCYYEGPTRIVITNAPGATPTTPTPTIQVYSPETPPTIPNYATCGGASLSSIAGASVTINSGTIYVANATTCQSPSDVIINTVSYACTDGTAVVQGVTGGALTIGADNNIVIDGNLLYADCASTNQDVLGLVATNSVEMANTTWTATPAESCASQLPKQVTANDAVVMASIFAMNGSFTLQVPNCTGAGGTSYDQILLYGNIVANYAGINGFPSSSTNCIGAHSQRALIYDTRLKSASSPFFPLPVASPNAPTSWAEITNPSGLPALP